ncbi:MAG: hypothetical protein GOV15_03935, partial [Candidatus Diapherotrites archaeon]|nr:hypothetical protein [Candidatus Diapherotrites archaeon]
MSLLKRSEKSEKGFVFSLDAALALFILFLVFFLSNYFLFESEPLGWQRHGLKQEVGD